MSEINVKPEDTLCRTNTTESILLPIPRDVFEKLYLNPKQPYTAGGLRKKLGNPTPVSLMGFLMASTPNACIVMGWRGAGGMGGAITYAAFVLCQTVAKANVAVDLCLSSSEVLSKSWAQLENGLSVTHSHASCFFTYGSYWIVQGTTMIPFFATALQFSEAGNSLEGMETTGYNASLGFYNVALAILTFVFLICSIRTNACLFLGLFLLVITYGIFAGAYFQLALGEAERASKLQYVGGAFALALCMPIWHIFIAQILETVDFPISLPVGDLSTIVLGKSQKAKQQEE